MLQALKQIGQSPKIVGRRNRVVVMASHAIGHISLLPFIALSRSSEHRTTVPSKILLIRVDGVGDLVMTTPLFRSLRRKYPHAQIDLVCSNAARSLAELFLTTGDLNHVYPLPFRPRLRQALGAIAMLRSNRYDIAVDLRGDFRSVLLAWMARAPVRYGITYSGFDFLLARTIQPGLVHQMEEVARLAELLGIPDMPREPHLPLAQEDRGFATSWLEAHGADPARPLVAMHLSAFQPAKLWPMERFAHVADHLRTSRQARILILGAPSDEPTALAFSAALSEPALIAAGKTTLPQSAALIEKCALFVGNDSGPAHMAAAVGCPVVVLFGPTEPDLWRPCGASVKTIRGTHPCHRACTSNACMIPDQRCLLTVTADEVCGAANALWPIR